ncbi:MAG: YciI family protein [Thermoleophilaceae bacterium]
MPQYMLLIYAPSDGGPSPEEMAEEMPRWEAYMRSLDDAGVRVGSGQLHPIETATTVRAHDGETQIVDGPFATTKEYLGGYFVLDCPDLDAALGHAARAPVVSYGSVEVRPLVERPAVAERENPARATA